MAKKVEADGPSSRYERFSLTLAAISAVIFIVVRLISRWNY
jgi:hypothetical protein